MSAPLWSPSESNNRALNNLYERANTKVFSELHNWSIDNSADFWRFVLTDSQVLGNFGDTVISGSGFFEAEFFPNSELNLLPFKKAKWFWPA